MKGDNKLFYIMNMENNKVKVSIIVPVYNVEKYLKRCLNSLIKQTLQEIEIIIVNDGSTDNSLAICKEFENIDKRIKVYSKNNEGLGLTRNYGISKCNGKYIAFVDSDDFVSLDFYEKMYTNIEENNTDAVFAEFRNHRNDGTDSVGEKNSFKEDIVSTKEYLYNILHVKNESLYGKDYLNMSVWRSLYKREIIEKYNIKFESERKFISEDILFNIDFCEVSNKISFQKDTYYYYCYNSDSLTKKYKKNRFEMDLILYEEIIRRMKKYNDYNSKIKCGIDNFFLGYLRAVIKDEVFCQEKTKPEKINRIKEILNNNSVRKILKNREYDTFTRKIYDDLMYFKQIYIIYYLVKCTKRS